MTNRPTAEEKARRLSFECYACDRVEQALPVRVVPLNDAINHAAAEVEAATAELQERLDRVVFDHAAIAADLLDRATKAERERDEARARLALIEQGEVIAEARAASQGDTALRKAERAAREHAAARREAYDRTGGIPNPPHGARSWLDYLAAHQHVGNRRCWQCEAALYARAEVERLRKILAEVRAENYGVWNAGDHGLTAELREDIDGALAPEAKEGE